MKKLLFLAVPALLMSCGPKQYTINGVAGADFEGKQAFLTNAEGVTVDSCVVTEGAFTFTGMVEDQSMYTVNVEKARANVMLQNGANVTIDLNERPANVSDNGGLNDIYNELISNVNVAAQAINLKRDSLMKAGVTPQEVRAAIEGDINAVYELYHEAIRQNKDNFVGAVVAGMVANQFYGTLEEMDSVIAMVKYASQIKGIKAHYEQLQTMEATKEGKMFVDFTGVDAEGKESKLSDYVGKGKYVLVDFWASWCGPCKGEIPHLKELHNKFNGEKFTVLGINVMDQEARFKAAMEEEGINYPQIVIPNGNKDNACELYGIQGIPQIILFGPDGVIVKRDLRGEAMKALVEEHGGRNLAAVSANVDFIVAGDNMGPAKRQKAEKLGIKILTLEEFLAMISDTPQIETEASASDTHNTNDAVQGTLF